MFSSSVSICEVWVVVRTPFVDDIDTTEQPDHDNCRQSDQHQSGVILRTAAASTGTATSAAEHGIEFVLQVLENFIQIRRGIILSLPPGILIFTRFIPGHILSPG